MAQDSAAVAASLLPADAETHIRAIMEGKDLAAMSLKEVRSQLETRLGKEPGSLDPAKAEIKAIVSSEITRGQEQAEGDGSASGSDGEGSKQVTKRDREADDESPAAKKAKWGKAKRDQASAMTRKAFMDNAEAFKVKLGDKEIKVPPKTFSTGSCGFYSSSKVTLDVAGHPLTLQCQFSCTIIGSKQWKDDES